MSFKEDETAHMQLPGGHRNWKYYTLSEKRIFTILQEVHYAMLHVESHAWRHDIVSVSLSSWELKGRWSVYIILIKKEEFANPLLHIFH